MTDRPGDAPLDNDPHHDSSTGGITRRDLLYLGGLTAGALAVPTVIQNINPVSASTAIRDTTLMCWSSVVALREYSRPLKLHKWANALSWSTKARWAGPV
jgi:hypothetical protein